MRLNLRLFLQCQINVLMYFSLFCSVGWILYIVTHWKSLLRSNKNISIIRSIYWAFPITRYYLSTLLIIVHLVLATILWHTSITLLYGWLKWGRLGNLPMIIQLVSARATRGDLGSRCSETANITRKTNCVLKESRNLKHHRAFSRTLPSSKDTKVFQIHISLKE